MTGSAADYPYDPRLIPEQLEGLEKLRTVRDRALAQTLYGLHGLMEQNESNPAFHRRERARAARREKAELTRLTAIADMAFEGKHGPEAKQLAQTILIDEHTFSKPRRTDLASLRVFAEELRALRKEDSDAEADL